MSQTTVTGLRLPRSGGPSSSSGPVAPFRRHFSRLYSATAHTSPATGAAAMLNTVIVSSTARLVGTPRRP